MWMLALALALQDGDWMECEKAARDAARAKGKPLFVYAYNY